MKLTSVTAEIRCEPVDNSVFVINGSWTVEKHLMTDCVESWCYIKENENRKQPQVCCHMEIISDFQKGCFSAMQRVKMEDSNF